MTNDAGGAAAVRTFLIADVRGYTRFTQVHGDEAGARLAARFAELVREQVQARGGHVLELRGDEALCIFDSPRAAIRAAVDIQRRCADETRADPALPLPVGIGIDAGEAVAVEGGYRGGPLNLAARLCSLAQRGEVLVSEGVVHLARRTDEVTYVDRGRMRLKGFDEPVQVMQARFELDLPEADVPATRRGITPGRLAAATVAAIAAVAAVVAVAATSGGGRHYATHLGTNVVGVLDGSGHIVGQVHLKAAPAGVASGAGSVWVAVGDRAEVDQVDPRARLISDRIGTGPGSDPTGVAVGGGGVWVTDSGNGRVIWINAADTNAHKPLRVGQGPGPIAFGEGAAWVINTTDGTLQRIDAGTLKPSAPIAVGGSPDAVTVGGGWVWVADSSSGSVIKIDPKTHTAVARPRVGNDPVALAYGGGYLWVANAADGSVTRLDPNTGANRPIPVGPNPTGIAYGPAGVWVTLNSPPAVARIDSQLHVTTTVVESTPVAAATVGDATWVSALAPPSSHRGGTLTAVFDTDNFTPGYSPFDPAVGPYGDHWQLISMLHDGLVTYRKLGGTSGLQVVPDLAVAMPTISDGGHTYTFQLRKGIRYSNGAPVRASDFTFSVRRQLAPGALTLGSGGYYQQVMLGSIKGVMGCLQDFSKCSLDQGIQTDDATGTITLHLTQPDPSLPQKLATTFGMLVPPISSAPQKGLPVPGTGPYKVATTYKNGQRGFLLVRNPYFRQWSAAAQPAGYPDKIRYVWVPTQDAELTAVERTPGTTGSADVMVDAPPASRLTELATRYATLAHTHADLGVTYLSLNTRAPPFSSLAARQAVNLAVDRRKLAAIAGGPQVSTPTCQVLPPGMFGYAPYCPYTAHPSAAGRWTAPDMARARQLVAQSGTRGDRVVIWVWGGSTSDMSLVPHLVKVLNQLGYRASAHITPATSEGFGEWNSTTANSKYRVSSVISGWAADYPNPADFIDLLLSCRAFVPGDDRNLNTSEFCDPKMDNLMRQAEAVQVRNPGLGAQLWQRADREAVDQAPWVPLINGAGIDVLSSRTGNYQWNPEWSVLLDQLWVH